MQPIRLDEVDKPTFTLFPTPPTPPKYNVYRGVETASPRKPFRPAVPSNQKSIHGKGENATSAGDSPLLRHKSYPKPLSIRTDVEVPAPTLSAPLPVRHTSRKAITFLEAQSNGASSPHNQRLLGSPVTQERASSVNAITSPSQRLYPQSQTQQASGQTTPQKVGVSSRTRVEGLRKRDSCGVSQWLDVEGGVDPKKLSVYLGGILDTSFSIEGLDDESIQSPPSDNEKTDKKYIIQANGTRVEVERQESIKSDKASETRTSNVVRRKPSPITKALPIRSDSHKTRPQLQPDRKAVSTNETTIRCDCPAGTVICPCRSSDEFEQFRRWPSSHKVNSSISSTVCLLSVPRARFDSPGGGNTDSKASSLETTATPPDLSYDSDGSNVTGESEWQLPESPNATGEILNTQSNPHTRQSNHMTNPSTSTNGSLIKEPRVTSFSRPFYAGTPDKGSIRTIRSTSSKSSKSPTLGSLGSISSTSPFTFDFDFDRKQQQQPLNTEPKKKMKKAPKIKDIDNDSEVFWVASEAKVAKATAKPVLVKYKSPSSIQSEGSKNKDGRAQIIDVKAIKTVPAYALRPLGGNPVSPTTRSAYDVQSSPTPRPRLVTVHH